MVTQPPLGPLSRPEDAPGRDTVGIGDKWALEAAGRTEPTPEGSTPACVCPDSWLRLSGRAACCSRRPEVPTLSGRTADRMRLLFPPGGLGAAVAVAGDWSGLLSGSSQVLLGGWPVLLLPGGRGGLGGTGPQQGLHDPNGPHSEDECPEQSRGLQGRQLFPYPEEGLGEGVARAAGPGWALVL